MTSSGAEYKKLFTFLSIKTPGSRVMSQV